MRTTEYACGTCRPRRRVIGGVMCCWPRCSPAVRRRRSPASAGGSSRSLSDLFSSSCRRPTAQAGTGRDAGASTEFDPTDCPPVDIRQGAATFSVNTAATNPSAMALRYQGVVAQTARECRASRHDLTIKVGVQGRVVLGPGGGPGSGRSAGALRAGARKARSRKRLDQILPRAGHDRRRPAERIASRISRMTDRADAGQARRSKPM